MKGRVEPEVQPKPEDEATKPKGTAPKQTGIVLKPDKKCDKMAYKCQFTPASNGNKSINKPNQGGKPRSPNGNSQNKSQIRDVPSYIRTEMEILKHLKRVNHKLKILLKPEYHCHKTPHGQKCCQPARNRKEQQAPMAKLNLPTQRKSSSSSKEKRASASLSDQSADKGEATATKKDQQVEPKESATQQRNYKCKCGNKCETVVRHPPGPTKFQRFILCFKPKRGGRCDKCKCTQATAVGEIKEQDGRTKQAANGKFLHRKYGQYRCEKHLPTITKQDSKITFNTRRARQYKPEKKSAKDERTLKQKMLGPCIKCLGKGDEPSRKTAAKKTVTKKEEKTTEKQGKTKTTLDTALDARKENVQTSNQEPGRESPKEKGSEKENEKVVAVAEVLQKYFHLLKPRKKEPQGDAQEEKSDLSKEYSLKKAREKKSYDVLTTLSFFPKPRHVTVKYVEDLETCYYEAKENNMKTPTDTPSTSSLEEYFQRLSERMVREQKEADERKPPPRRKRVTSRTRLQRPRQQPRRMRISS